MPMARHFGFWQNAKNRGIQIRADGSGPGNLAIRKEPIRINAYDFSFNLERRVRKSLHWVWAGKRWNSWVPWTLPPSWARQSHRSRGPSLPASCTGPLPPPIKKIKLSKSRKHIIFSFALFSLQKTGRKSCQIIFEDIREQNKTNCNYAKTIISCRLFMVRFKMILKC